MQKKKIIKQKNKGVNHSMFHIGGGKTTGPKIKSWVGLRGSLSHSLRIAGAGNVDPDHTDKNIHMFDITPPEDPKEALSFLKKRFDTITKGLARRGKGRDKVLCEDLLFTTSPLWWNRDENGNYLHDDKENKEKLAEWVKFHEEYIDKKFGKENVVYCNVQLDETTPHISCQVVPIRIDKKGNRVISHSHFFDGKVETSEGYKVNKLANEVGKYQNSIHKVFPTLEPSVKAKADKESKKVYFPKQHEVKAKRKSVREYYGDKDEINKEVKENKGFLKRIKEAIIKEKAKEEGLDLSIQNKERIDYQLNKKIKEDKDLSFKEANQLIKLIEERKRLAKNAYENENYELVEEIQESLIDPEKTLSNFKKENPNFKDWREDTNKKKRRNGPGF